MITAALITFFTWILSLFVFILPSVTALPSGITSALSYVVNAFQLIGFLFPMATLALVVQAGILFEAGILAFKALNFALKKIRGSG